MLRSHMEQQDHPPPTAFHMGVIVQLPMTAPSQWVWITGSVELKMAMAGHYAELPKTVLSKTIWFHRMQFVARESVKGEYSVQFLL